MRHFLSIFLIVFIFPGTINAQTPTPRITREIHPYAWYQTQSQKWQSEVAQNPKSDQAWINFYEANRAAKIVNGGKSPVSLDEIMTDLKSKANESFAWHFLTYRNAGWDDKLFSHLEEAWKLKPNFPGLAEEFVTYHELKSDPANRKKYNHFWFDSGEMPGELLTYNYNVLMSLEDNAILITNGDNDTYPVWMLQDVQGVKTEVLVINRSLARMPEYLNKLLKRKGIPAFDYQPEGEQSGNTHFDQLIDHLLGQSKRPLYFASTIGQDVIYKHRKNLYLTGLASKYSEERFDNISQLVDNVENHFLLDYLKINLTPVSPYSSVQMMRQSYLTPLLTLHRHYLENGQKAKVEETRKIIENTVKGTKYEREVLESLR
ncbi:MAG: hypothetical protein R3B93_21980 [Bacteroidia bacterium]